MTLKCFKSLHNMRNYELQFCTLIVCALGSSSNCSLKIDGLIHKNLNLRRSDLDSLKKYLWECDKWWKKESKGHLCLRGRVEVSNSSWKYDWACVLDFSSIYVVGSRTNEQYCFFSILALLFYLLLMIFLKLEKWMK